MALSALEARLWVLDRLKESYGSVAFTAALGDICYMVNVELKGVLTV